MKKLNCILLVEDDDTTNFYNQFLIENLSIADQVAVALNGQEALEYLEKAGHGDAVTPDLILLDINMPVMNGPRSWS
jgi:CheY-like chemotaxis protein